MRTWNIVFCPVIALIGFSSVYGESKYERLVFDVTSQKQAIDGFGAFIWPNDLAIPILFQRLEELNVKYVRVDCGPYWPMIEALPPTDGKRESFDSYYAENYGKAGPLLSQMKEMWTSTQRLGIKNIMTIFHIPLSWEGPGRALKPEHYDDYAKLWGSTVKFFADQGMSIPLIEISNEPDGNWNYNAPPAEYNIILKKVRAELDFRGYKQVGIVAPGRAHIDFGESEAWTDALDAEAIASLAGFSIHPYERGAERNQEGGQSYLRDHWHGFAKSIATKDPAGQIPIIVTEYSTNADTFHGVVYPSNNPHVKFSASDTIPFAVRLYENTLSLMNCGANVMIIWEASDQCWSDHSWGLIRRPADGSTARPMFHAMKTLLPYVPVGSRVLAPPEQPKNDIYASAVIKDGRLVIGMANGTLQERSKTLVVAGVDHIRVSGAVMFQAKAGDPHESFVSEKTLEVYDGNSIDVTLPMDSTLTIICDVGLSK